MSMNLFRAGGDLLHLLSIIIILLKIRTTKNCAGISLKSQELYALVFVTRYLDLLHIFSGGWSTYLVFMKLIFLTSSFTIIYYMRGPYKSTYDKEHDSFRVAFLLAPCMLLAVISTQEYSLTEILWTFSLYLEAVAILPQLFLLQRTGEIENLTSDYIFALGAYRALYLLNWIFRYFTEPNYTQWIVWIAGIVQTAIYCDFFYYYIRSKYYGKKMTLPN